jgi:hypothetical protein
VTDVALKPFANRQMFLELGDVECFLAMGTSTVLANVFHTLPNFPVAFVTMAYEVAVLEVLLHVRYWNLVLLAHPTRSKLAGLHVLRVILDQEDLDATITSLKLSANSGAVKVVVCDRYLIFATPCAPALGASLAMGLKFGLRYSGLAAVAAPFEGAFFAMYLELKRRQLRFVAASTSMEVTACAMSTIF